MKAIVYNEHGSADVLRCEELPVPVPADGEVLVRVRAAALNAMDGYFLAGKYAKIMRLFGGRKSKQGRFGTDFAGEITAVGAAAGAFNIGDAVFGAARGTVSEYITVSAERIAPKPANATFEQASALAIAGVTALQALRDVARVQPRQQVLIVGAGGGVGSFVVQIAKAFGAIVTAITSPTKLHAVASLGADRVAHYADGDYLSGEERYDVIVDCSGRRSLREFRRALAPRGIFVGVGANPNAPLMIIPRLVGMMILSRFTSKKMPFFMARARANDLVALKELVEGGRVTPHIPRVFAFAEAAEAMREFQSGHLVGKVVISVP